jgi:hypothetical protein
MSYKIYIRVCAHSTRTHWHAQTQKKRSANTKFLLRSLTHRPRIHSIYIYIYIYATHVQTYTYTHQVVRSFENSTPLPAYLCRCTSLYVKRAVVVLKKNKHDACVNVRGHMGMHVPVAYVCAKTRVCVKTYEIFSRHERWGRSCRYMACLTHARLYMHAVYLHAPHILVDQRNSHTDHNQIHTVHVP